MPAISVLMSAYNETPAVLTKAVNSILVQSLSDFELIIMNDNPDNAELEDVLSVFPQNDPRVKVIRNSNNFGLAKSLNRGIDICVGHYICRMDADDISEPNRLEVQLDYLEANELDLIGSSMLVINEDGDKLYFVGNLPQSSQAVARALRYNNCVPHPTWFGKKDVFDMYYRQVPLCEDYDFLIRAVLAGFRLGNVNKELVQYRMSQGSLSRTHLYKQFLYQKELTRSYVEGKLIDLDDAKAHVESLASAQAEMRYTKANRAFNNGLAALRSNQPLHALAQFGSVPFTSWAYLNKVYRLVRAALIKG